MWLFLEHYGAIVKNVGFINRTMEVLHWNKVLYVDQKTGCADLVMDPNDPNTLYASMWEFRRTGWSFESGGSNSALYKSTDGGATWNKIHNGFPEGRPGKIGYSRSPIKS